MSREFTYELVEGFDKRYIVTTNIDSETVSFTCVVANSVDELADLLEFSIETMNNTLTYEPPE